MRDGVKLFTSVYVPKECSCGDVSDDDDSARRTASRPYGVDQYPATLGPSEFFAKEKFIFVYQDVRGRYMSEGEYVPIRPHKPVKNGPKDTDESTDTYDTIDWLVKHVPGNTGKVGMWGISQPGFYATRGDDRCASGAGGGFAAGSGDRLLPGRRCVSQRRVHAGAPVQFLSGVPAARGRSGAAAGGRDALRFGTPDGYEFYLNMGSLANADEKYFKHKQPLWTLNIDHYDLRRGLAIAGDLEASEEHQAGGDAGGRLVRHGGSAGPAAAVRFYGEELARRQPTCW